MADPRRMNRLAWRLLTAILVVAVASLAVHFVGTVIPHLLADPPSQEDAVSTGWLLTATAVALLTATLLAVLVAIRLAAPIDGYVETARRFAAGDHAARPGSLGPPEFADLTQALIAAADHIESTEQARRRLTADIAHELRTPLTALQAGLEEMKDGHVPADRAALVALHDQARRLSRIVNDVSNLALAESSELPLTMTDVDLAGVAERELHAWFATLMDAGLSVDRDLVPGVFVRADEGRLREVVANLLSNAGAYCRRGDRITVRVRPDGRFGRLEVRDTGPGLRADDVPLVFDRAWRGSSAAGTSGSGLGLPIVRALVRAQGGTVSLQSVEGRGTVVTLLIPMSAP